MAACGFRGGTENKERMNKTRIIALLLGLTGMATTGTAKEEAAK